MEAGPGERLPPPSVNCTIWRPCARISSRKGGKHCVHCTAFTGLTFLLKVFIFYVELTDKNFLNFELGQIIESFRISGSIRL